MDIVNVNNAAQRIGSLIGGFLLSGCGGVFGNILRPASGAGVLCVSVASLLLLFFIPFQTHLFLPAFRLPQIEVVVVKVVGSSMNVAFRQDNLVYDNPTNKNSLNPGL